MKEGRYLLKIDQYRDGPGKTETWLRLVCDDCPGRVVKVVRGGRIMSLDGFNEAAEEHDGEVHAEELTLQESLE